MKKLLACLLALSMVFSTAIMTSAQQIADDEGKINYIPQEEGVYSNGGYTIEKISHPTLGAGYVDGILTGDEQDRGNSYSWSMAEAGDYIYIGTCYNSTYYIYHNNVETTLKNFQSQGILDSSVNASQVADDLVQVVFGETSFTRPR